MALALLPMTPCALVSQVCRTPASAVAQADAEAPASCCAETHQPNSPSRESPDHRPPSDPCARGCCRVSPIAPLVEKTAAAQPAGLALVGVELLLELQIASGLAPRAELLPPTPSLQSLHCLLRC